MADYRIAQLIIFVIMLGMLTVNSLTEELDKAGRYHIDNMQGVASRQHGMVLYLNGDNRISETQGRIKRSTNQDIKSRIKSLSVVSQIAYRFSRSIMTSQVVNDAEEDSEASFIVQIPQTAFIDNFTMIIDGKLFVAAVKEKSQAEKEYEEAKDRNETAGLVGSEPPDDLARQRGMDIFSVAVNLKAQSSAEFSLSYQELLQRRRGIYEHLTSVRPLQPIESLSIQVYLYEPQGFKSINVAGPSVDASKDITIIDTSEQTKRVSYVPTTDPGKTTIVVDGELTIHYDVKHSVRDPGYIKLENNYFVHFFSPDGFSPISKNIIYVIDVSGSMSGDKMKQTRAAFSNIIGWMNPDDRFMLLLFDDKIKYWPSNMVLIAANSVNIANAKTYANAALVANGGTDINQGLLSAIQRFPSDTQIGKNIIMFLTDGQPTSGVTNPDQIVRNVVEMAHNGERATIFSLGFGFNLDFELLERLSLRTGGFARRVYTGSDGDVQLMDIYQEIGTPLICDVSVIYKDTNVVQNSVTKQHFLQYFNGSEKVITGIRKEGSPEKWDVCVKGTSSGPVELCKRYDMVDTNVIPKEAELAYEYGTIEKLYAYLKIKDMLDKMMIEDNEETVEYLRERALNMSLKYNLVTPLTSLVIVQSGYGNDFNENYPNMGMGATVTLTQPTTIVITLVAIAFNLLIKT